MGKPTAVVIDTKTFGQHRWVIEKDEGYLIDPEVSVAHVRLINNPGEAQPEQKIQVLELFPWSEIMRMQFLYEETPVVPSTIVN